ncbi:MAG: nucleotidyltransferase domain-containing protein [Cyclobacteriaceae bacterium]|nr:nucleotidyltransferase domain-containing protein [Cyclobacteriaceae bacterium]
MTDQHDILNRIKEIVLDRDPSAKIYLYGSRAKGTMKPDSDWDLLILLNIDQVTTDLEKSVTHPLYDLEFETGEVISPMVYSEREWNTKYSVTPFYSSVMNDGKLL